uniref:Uncharacterized protein n=1 Tax=Chromera velia CCMP2878 TaxID=1169474 RepID=A0A0G4HQK3_9ALVE|eukprot:Cvel_7955.t1-p1 / transcript=Cvel_7955.t1 / gene=Cvel_7955 / organism=Chromera_velia_CCMP2878 / gene_product=hypothetical protein / transcript_product=hypothetical protein / location=Cvel_scaffold428:7314-8096(-) / protein_length=261 / sequence_SO=supercontig / SO=protein_coding / is_pseudo=false
MSTKSAIATLSFTLAAWLADAKPLLSRQQKHPPAEIDEQSPTIVAPTQNYTSPSPSYLNFDTVGECEGFGSEQHIEEFCRFFENKGKVWADRTECRFDVGFYTFENHTPYAMKFASHNIPQGYLWVYDNGYPKQVNKHESHDTLAGWFREIPPAKDGKPGKYCMLGTAYWRIVKKSRAGAKADITFTSSETGEDVTLQVYSPWDTPLKGYSRIVVEPQGESAFVAEPGSLEMAEHPKPSYGGHFHSPGYGTWPTSPALKLK